MYVFFVLHRCCCVPAMCAIYEYILGVIYLIKPTELQKSKLDQKTLRLGLLSFDFHGEHTSNANSPMSSSVALYVPGTWYSRYRIYLAVLYMYLVPYCPSPLSSLPSSHARFTAPLDYTLVFMWWYYITLPVTTCYIPPRTTLLAVLLLKDCSYIAIYLSIICCGHLL